VLALGVTGALAVGLTDSLNEHSAHISNASVHRILAMHETLGFATGIVFASLLAPHLLWLLPNILITLPLRHAAEQQMGTWLQDALPGLERRQLPPPLVGAYLLGSLVYDPGVGTPNGVIPFLTSL
jgi:hypothetical protein